MINGRSIQAAASVLFLCLFLVACGGDGNSFVITGNQGGGGNESAADSDGTVDSDDDSPTPEPDKVTFEELMASSVAAEAFGTVVDSPVSGLRYKSGNHYGITDSDGKYGYIQGELVEFFIGDIRIGHAITPVARVTPYELANSDPQVTLNIARFLQSLDNDAIVANGIHLHEAMHALAADTAVDFSSADWQDNAPSNAVLADEKLVSTRPGIELLVTRLTSATEAGARGLISTDAATSHLVFTLGEIINALAAEAKSLMAASTCETDLQCKWFHLSPRDIGGCPPRPEAVVYSEVDADITAIERLEAQRDYLIDVDKQLWNTAWPDHRTSGSCWISVTPTYAICGETNHCEITTSLPMAW